MAIDLEKIRKEGIKTQSGKAQAFNEKKKTKRPWQSFEKEQDLLEIITGRPEKTKPPRQNLEKASSAKSETKKITKGQDKLQEMADKYFKDI